MLRRFRIRTRLLISFFILVFFTLVIGLTGFISLTSIGNMAVRTMHNVRTLNSILDYNMAVRTGINSVLQIRDPVLINFVMEATREMKNEALREIYNYLEIQSQFYDVFTPGEMQNMINIFEIYIEEFIPLVDEIFKLIEQGLREEATILAVNRLTPIHNTITYIISEAFRKNLEHSGNITTHSNEIAWISAHIMLALALISLAISILLAFQVTKSISAPLSALGSAAGKIANGELDVQIQQSESDDEIARLSLRLEQTLLQLNQAQEIKFAAIEAQHEKEKAEASARSKGEFLAKMSHEIRTPMNAITGMAEIALRENMSSAAREHILTIRQAGANLLSIINDILDFSKIESGKLDIVPVNYFFSSLLDDVINIIKMKVIDSRICFIVDIDSKIPNALFGDEIRIRQILLNILSNAVKYTDEGYVSLSITKAPGENAAEDSVNLIMEVADSGRGIKQEDIEKLFGNFVRVNLERNRGKEGTGLGLAITKGLVKAMDGEIFVYSEYGVGSAFTVKLPQKICGNETVATVLRPEEKRVLVYEPHDVYANSIIRSLDYLNVSNKRVLTEDDLFMEMTSNNFEFVFTSEDLYDEARDFCFENKLPVKIAMLSSFCNHSVEQDINVLPMPAHSISIANYLNGIVAANLLMVNNEVIVKFTAPKAKILVVDDIYTNLKVAEGLLSPYKMQVKLCKSGKEAITSITSGINFDIVFMDHMMPEMDGIEAVSHIRVWEKEQRKEQVPIVALTANAVTGMREMFVEKGFNDFLPKPVDLSKLDEILARWIPQDKMERNVFSDKAATEAASQFPAIEGVDTAKGFLMTGGTEHAYKTVLSIFYRDIQERLPHLEREITAELLPDFILQFHTLRGACSSVGALEISAEAGKLELAGRAGDIDSIQNRKEGFTYKLKRLAYNIKTMLDMDRDSENAEKQEEDTHAELYPALSRLETALENKNIVEIEQVLDELSKNAQNNKINEVLKDISDDVLMTEFDTAIEKIKKLIPDKPKEV